MGRLGLNREEAEMTRRHLTDVQKMEVYAATKRLMLHVNGENQVPEWDGLNKRQIEDAAQKLVGFPVSYGAVASALDALKATYKLPRSTSTTVMERLANMEERLAVVEERLLAHELGYKVERD
jgi:hypothetical protein